MLRVILGKFRLLFFTVSYSKNCFSINIICIIRSNHIIEDIFDAVCSTAVTVYVTQYIFIRLNLINCVAQRRLLDFFHVSTYFLDSVSVYFLIIDYK